MKLLTRVLLPALIVLLGLGCAGMLVLAAPSAEKSATPPVVTAVEVVTVSPEQAVARVQATGTVVAARKVTLSSEVSGRVVKQSNQLLAGGRFRQGDVIAQVDPRDYQVAVAQERTRLHQAELELELEQARQRTSAREWELLGDGRPADQAPLALRRPHLAAAEQSVEAARAGLARAELNLERTVLRAPFNAMVVDEQLEVGQIVGPGTPAVTLIGTDAFWVDVSIPMSRLGGIELPGADGATGSPAVVRLDVGGGRFVHRSGRVRGLAGQLDPQTRTARVIVELPDPLAGEGLPLLPGAFVSVEIAGRALPDVVAVPREAVWNGDRVWVVDDQERLASRVVEVGWRGEDALFVTSGLGDGDRVVTSPLSLPIEGMAVRIEGAPRVD